VVVWQLEVSWLKSISALCMWLTVRALGGPQMILSSGIACGVLLGVIEGVGVLMQRMFAEGTREWQ
jgi:import inner membrane translocase subunit TIM17